MKGLKFLIGPLIYCLTYSTYGQVKCAKENLIGRWRQVESISGVQTNVDSLKHLIVKSSKTIGTFDLKADGTYKYTFLDKPNKTNHNYSLETSTCEIILGARRKSRKHSNLEIIYLDNQFLIFWEDNNPKGDITHLMVKIEGGL